MVTQSTTNTTYVFVSCTSVKFFHVKLVIKEYKYPHIPTKFSKDRLYCLVTWVWIVIRINPITIPTFPTQDWITNGENIIKDVPKYITPYWYNNAFNFFLFFIIKRGVVTLPIFYLLRICTSMKRSKFFRTQTILNYEHLLRSMYPKLRLHEC